MIERFTKFRTRKGRKVTALGVLFDFTGNDHNTTVQKVEDMVKESWFKEAIKEEPDFFLLVGYDRLHLPVKVMLTTWAADTCPFRGTTVRRSIAGVRYITDAYIGPAVHSAVRAVHPNTPILILGGHSHIRDCGKQPFLISQMR